MKKIVIGATVAALAVGLSFSASAAVIDGVTDSSVASSLATWLIKVVMRNTNGAYIENNVTSSGNSGGNMFTSADDQSGTMLVTGNASAATLVDNNANNNVISEEYESSNGADNTISNVEDDSSGSTASDDTLDNFMKTAMALKFGTTLTPKPIAAITQCLPATAFMILAPLPADRRQ